MAVQEKLTDLATNRNFYKKAILQYTDGRFLTGYTNDFFPHIPFFHLSQLSNKSVDKETTIYLDDLKTILFDQDIKEKRLADVSYLSENKGTSSNKLEIVFKDGEILTGTMVDFRPNSFGFFLLTDQNNTPMRVFAISTAIRKTRDVK